MASTGFFTLGLTEGFAKSRVPAAGFIAIDGLAADGTNTRRAANVAIYGIDDAFFAFHGFPAPAGDEGAFGGRQALVSPALARDLGVAAGDSVLARLPSPSVVPSSTLHGRRDTLGKTMRATVRAVLPESGLGTFSLRPQQGEVRAIYLPLARVQRELERPDRINAIVAGAPGAAAGRRARGEDARGRRAFAARHSRRRHLARECQRHPDRACRRRGPPRARSRVAVDPRLRLSRSHRSARRRARYPTRSSLASSSTSSIPRTRRGDPRRSDLAERLGRRWPGCQGWRSRHARLRPVGRRGRDGVARRGASPLAASCRWRASAPIRH